MSGYTHQDVRSVPPGWKVRTVKAREHRVRVAFPPGRRETGSGVVVAVLHPKTENPNTCTTRQKNPAELILMGANPIGTTNQQKKATRERAERIRAARLSNPYDSLDLDERLAFGRLGLGKAQLQSAADIRRARKQVAANKRFKNRLPNPGGSGGAASTASIAIGEEADRAQDLYERFHETESAHYTVLSEPHMQSGDYTDLGEFLDVKVKPANGGPVQVISFEGNDIRLVCDAGGRQLYLAGDGQDLDNASLSVFSNGAEDRLLLGKARNVAYQAVKWHPEVPDGARGKDKPYEHRFGEDRGTEPDVWYSRSMRRLIIGRASYHVEGAGIVN
jgi:hypothetical protein